MDNNSLDEFSNGVSIESASYMENNNKIELNGKPLKKTINENSLEEHTPKLFSEEKIVEENESKESLRNDNDAEQLFDQDTNEDEDFEIPAFLRRQKF